MRIYLDSAPVIYVVEDAPGLAGLVDDRISTDGVVRVVSELTRLECRVKPMRDEELAVLKDFDDFFEYAVEEILPLSREVIDLATEIRGQHGFRTPDAIHLAAAVHSGCESFLTNDRRLSRFTDISVECVPGLSV